MFATADPLRSGFLPSAGEQICELLSKSDHNLNLKVRTDFLKARDRHSGPSRHVSSRIFPAHIHTFHAAPKSRGLTEFLVCDVKYRNSKARYAMKAYGGLLNDCIYFLSQ
jgi:hypothetical protein